MITERLEESIKVKREFVKRYGKTLDDIAKLLAETFQNGGKLLIIGNGGSASDAQHMAAEFTGRFLKDRRPLPAIALTTDTSAITAIANDYGYDEVFKRQVEALATSKDVLIAISTSGNSMNVIKATKAFPGHTVGLTGGDGGKLADICNTFMSAEFSVNSGIIQETHIWAIHTIIDVFEQKYLDKI